MTPQANPERSSDLLEKRQKLPRLRRLNRRFRERLVRYRRLAVGAGTAALALLVLVLILAFDDPDPVLLGNGQAGVMTPESLVVDTLMADPLMAERLAPAPPEAVPAPPAEEPGRAAGEGEASYYSERLTGNPTASGEPYNPGILTAAHRTLPLGSRVRVTNLRNGESVIVRINDRGPFAKRRVIDLSRAAASEIGMLQSGVAPVRLELLPAT